MSNSRTILISLDHLVAEVVAFPFGSPDSLAVPLEALDPQLTQAATATLWRQAERYFVRHFPHLSLDELIAVRNWTWFHEADHQPIPLDRFVRCLAENWLDARGALAKPKLPECFQSRESPEPAARRAWRWMTFALPADLLVAALRRDGQGPERVELGSPIMDTILHERGYAETHLHLGAALEFPTFWAAAMNLTGRSSSLKPGMAYDAFQSPGAEHDEGKLLASWLVRSAIVRYLLGAFLHHRTSSMTLREFLEQLPLGPGLAKSQASDLVRAIRDLRSGRLSWGNSGPQSVASDFIRMQSTYNRLTQASNRPLPDRLADVQQGDPLAAFFAPLEYDRPSVQMQFLAGGMQYLDRTPRDAEFARLFWQVERVRHQVYRHTIQRPLTPGLMNFIRFYERKGAASKLLENVELESAGTLGGAGRGLRSLEVRLSPRDDYDLQSKELLDLRKRLKLLCDEANSPWRDVECGVAIHFLKIRGKDADKGRPRAFDKEGNADPEFAKNTMRFRWQAFYQGAERQADAIAGAVSRQPSLLEFLRAIDVCRDEHGTPTWVVAPLFDHVRRRVRRVSETYARKYGKCLPTLRTTAHVGEDFVHLTTGLRYMDEAIEHLPLECGDRIGHGLALGVDPDTWSKKAWRLTMPREDRWFDLIWERVCHGTPGASFGSDRKTYVDNEIVRLSNTIFAGRVKDSDGQWTPLDAVEFVERLYDFSALRRLGFPNRQTPDVATLSLVDRRLHAFLTNASVYRKCREVEWVQAEKDGPAVAELQRLVRKRYAETGVTIEVNPISNLLVGDLTDLQQHPLWRLAPGFGDKYGPTLRMCIGSDDPLPFSTNLPLEYQFLYDSLVLAECSHADARKWLEEIRTMGMETRFTRPK